MKVVVGTCSKVNDVPTQAVAKIVVEVPIEFYQEAVAVLYGKPVMVLQVAVDGLPGIHDTDQFNAIGEAFEQANEPPTPEPAFPPPPASEPVEKTPPDKQKFTDMPRSKQAGIACGEPAFYDFCAAIVPKLSVPDDADAKIKVEAAKQIVYAVCHVKSRAELTPDGAQGKAWQRMWSAYWMVKHRVITASNYVAAIKELGCAAIRQPVKRRAWSRCDAPSNAHHIRENTGMGLKAPWYEQIPLCKPHHQDGGRGVAYHAGEDEWENNFGTQHENVMATHGMLLDDYLAKGGALDET